MFSSFIQNLLNTGGQSAAMQRAAQMNAHLNRLYPQAAQQANQSAQAPLTTSDLPANMPKSFNEALQSSMTQSVNFGQLLLNPKVKSVNARLSRPQNDVDNVYGEIEAI